MKNTLVKNSLAIFGGSAVSGMGFSLGRDVYKKSKKQWRAAIILLLSCFMLYTSGVWVSRNYKSVFKSLFFRIGAVCAAIPSAAILFLASSVLFIAAQGVMNEITPELKNPIVTNGDEQKTLQGELQVEDVLLDYIGSNKQGFILPGLVFLVGSIVGLTQRSKRQQVWDAETHNLKFMKNHHLVEHEDGTIEDMNECRRYRVDHVGEKRITLFPLGKRGQRAYITISDDGKYAEFTGLTTA